DAIILAMTASTNQRASHGSSGCLRARRDPIAIVAHKPVTGTTTHVSRADGKERALSRSTMTPRTAKDVAIIPCESEATAGRFPFGPDDRSFASRATFAPPPPSPRPPDSGAAASSRPRGSRGRSGRRYIHHDDPRPACSTDPVDGEPDE